MKSDYDVVVVGSGPAGCSFINSLNNDFNALLIDQQKIPLTKICGGLLTEESSTFLKGKNLDIPSEVYSTPKILKKMYVNIDNKKEIENGYVYNINRDNFNNWLLSLADKKSDLNFLIQKKMKNQKLLVNI